MLGRFGRLNRGNLSEEVYHSQYCNRSYGNITYLGTHDSYAVGTNNLAVNQDYDSALYMGFKIPSG